MRPTPPLSVLLPQIVAHTPQWVWAILAALVVFGLLQMRDRVVSRTRLVIVPLALGAFSLWGAVSTFGLRPEVAVAWTAGMALALAPNRLLDWPREVRLAPDGRFALRGSPWPLLLMLGIFALRYVGTVTLVLHPEWKLDPIVSLGVSLAYGAMSGLFAARAARILGADRPAVAPLLA